ncbi:P-loop ATPase, Sll1717 family [Sphingomonas albertensis]|uniref:ATP-binding protein n=1 Tax=Sphingomonas albertensis TaxID=2762591 RepID=A0ABR7AIQ7_9SPHN|nr:hypothetical protein [Sphingomonas albertensis]MBC3940340.1 hypothetical protein [Sphingomonas albertensis]
MNVLPKPLQNLHSIGEVNAEEDAVLQYFLATDATSKVAQNRVYLVLGRKGAGKTALVRHFTKDDADPLSKPLNLRSYAWNVHAAVQDKRSSDIEAYVASWRYVIATQAASAILEQYPQEIGDAARKLRSFFEENYGNIKVDLANVFSIKRLKFSAATIEPKLAGNSLGSLSLSKEASELGYVIDAVSDEILNLVQEVMGRRKSPKITLHFDELDSGIEKLERDRELMIAGLVLAAQSVRRSLGGQSASIQPFVYLREDIWQAFAFSDRNKITYGASQRLSWSKDTLLDLVNVRIKSLAKSDYSFSDLIDDQQMPGNQPKWDYIVGRTHDRPRDIIAYINLVLERKKPDFLISNGDVSSVRAAYSSYFKGELEDEVKAHWPKWEEAIRAIGDIGYLTFEKIAFKEKYEARRSEGNSISDYERALEILYNYSVIAYLRPRPSGGTDWIWKYKQPDQNFDSKAERFKVHLGLQEFANLRSERRVRHRVSAT